MDRRKEKPRNKVPGSLPTWSRLDLSKEGDFRDLEALHFEAIVGRVIDCPKDAKGVVLGVPYASVLHGWISGHGELEAD